MSLSCLLLLFGEQCLFAKMDKKKKDFFERNHRKLSKDKQQPIK